MTRDSQTDAVAEHGPGCLVPVDGGYRVQRFRIGDRVRARTDRYAGVYVVAGEEMVVKWVTCDPLPVKGLGGGGIDVSYHLLRPNGQMIVAEDWQLEFVPTGQRFNVGETAMARSDRYVGRYVKRGRIYQILAVLKPETGHGHVLYVVNGLFPGEGHLIVYDWQLEFFPVKVYSRNRAEVT